MNIDILGNFVVPIIVALASGILSSFLWWLITRKVCFPTIDVDENIILESNGDKIVKVRNKDAKYGAYDITCYVEYRFTYKNRRLKCSLIPRNIPYIKALGEEDILVNLPTREIGNEDEKRILLVDAFNQSVDGKLHIKIVAQNKYGVKKNLPNTFIVDREVEKVSEY